MGVGGCRGVRDRQEGERERVRVEPEPASDGNGMRLNHVPTGQLTSARSSLTNPPGPFMPRPDANKGKTEASTHHPNRSRVRDNASENPRELCWVLFCFVCLFDFFKGRTKTAGTN